MTLIDFGDFKIRFDPKEIRINIDGELIDIGARRDDEEPDSVLAGDLPTNDELKEMVRLGFTKYEPFKKWKVEKKQSP